MTTFLKESLVSQCVKSRQLNVIFDYANLIGKMWVTHLSLVASLVAPCYSSSPRRSPPRDPVNLFRSLLVMS